MVRVNGLLSLPLGGAQERATDNQERYTLSRVQLPPLFLEVALVLQRDCYASTLLQVQHARASEAASIAYLR